MSLVFLMKVEGYRKEKFAKEIKKFSEEKLTKNKGRLDAQRAREINREKKHYREVD